MGWASGGLPYIEGKGWRISRNKIEYMTLDEETKRWTGQGEQRQ